MSENEFVHLHVHTEYSLLDGLSRIDSLVDRAKALNMKSLAITDHGTMFGVIDFYRACKSAGIKPIIGVESYLARASMHERDPKLDKKAFHMLLLAKDETGYKNLLKIASKAQLEGYYYRPRIDREFLAAHSQGLIATSGCLASQIPSAVIAGQDDEARELLGWYSDVFGKENFFLELQHHDIPELEVLNKWLVENRDYADLQFVATNDVHYVLAEDYDPHDTLLCIQTTSLKRDIDRLRMSDASYHLTSVDEMWRHFGHIRSGEALRNTLKVAEMCSLDLDTKGYHLPIFPVPEGYTADGYLRYLCEKGLVWRYGPGALENPALRQRLDHELAIIHSMGFDTYFLIVWDLCEYARERDLWWNVRGSGAGSVAAYSLGITSIDPIENNLLFERFLNPGRVSMPDIDLDYPDDRRGEMIDYAARKYGEDKVAAIITFGTMGPKAAVRDVGRALDVPLSVVNQAAKLIPTEPKPKPIMEYVDGNPELRELYDKDPDIRKVIDTARTLQGVNRHASTHAAGVIIADKPLVEYIPLHRLTSGDDSTSIKAVTQFPMETCESIGLLKIDFLGLSTLTILRKACDLIERHRRIKYTMSNIPYRHEHIVGDEAITRQLNEAFELIGRGETVGVFQVESGGMQQMLRGMRPQRFEHIIAAISLYRPGPMDYIPTFNARMHGEEEVKYLHPKLEAILGETYGICISGDSLIFDAITGQRFRVDEIKDRVGDFYIQGVNTDYRASIGHVTHWHSNGLKDVYRLTLRNGAAIKATADHRFLTEAGWKQLSELNVGDYVATPSSLLEPQSPANVEREKLRALAYLIADGSLSTLAAVDFVNKDPRLIDEYVRCLAAFENVNVTYINQIHDVTRVSSKNGTGKGVSPLLAWMRELGLKYPPGRALGGCRSQEKFIPDLVFQLSNDDLAYFLASLWDCDGYMGQKLCHYKTISKQLAFDVKSALLRLGIDSRIHTAKYASKRGERTAYQVIVYDTARFSSLVQPHMLTEKQTVKCQSVSGTTIDRANFLSEVRTKTDLSSRALMATYGIDRQHFIKKGRSRERISSQVVYDISDQLALSRTQSLLNLIWEPVASIEPAGTEQVYDLTVENLHNFVANNIVVHNCVYQEQIMQIAGDLFGYPLDEADLMRRAVSKKKEKDLLKHKSIFMERGPENGVDPETAEKIFNDIEFFANYGFNKCVVGSTEIVDAQTGRLIRVEDLASGREQVAETLTCDTRSLRLKAGQITAIMSNGVKPVYRLTTQLGRQIEATDNHPFYTFDGWRMLSELSVGDQIATPRRLPVEGLNIWPDEKVTALGHSLYEGNSSDAFIPAEAFTLQNAQISLLLSALTGSFMPINSAEVAAPIEAHLSAPSRLYAALPTAMQSDPIHACGSFLEESNLPFLTTFSKRLAQQVQHLLLRVGVVSRLSSHHKSNLENGLADETNMQYAIYVEDQGFSEEFDNDIYWDKVVRIEYVGEQPTYDLTIEGTHNFVANDIIVHNSHAADYAVITVQTAFLKTHYTEEYMTALLSVHRDDSTKIAHFLEECRRLNIPILPPDVNFSMLDFDIQQQSSGRRGIRFGLAAVKNAGAGALQPILDMREQDGPFNSLEDFCRRVDLRTVGKRTIESLIKVGAFSSLNPNRKQLLEALDRIMSFSANDHKDREVGQMNMFGGGSGLVAETLELPNIEETSPREMLGWEKELLGLYVTGRPVDKYREYLQHINTIPISELKSPESNYNGRAVAIAGEVVSMRKIVTKNNDMMCVVQLEDWRESASSIEVVFFPRAWQKALASAQVTIEEGEIILVRGKFDSSRNDPQIIAEEATQDFRVLRPENGGGYVPPRDETPPWAHGDDGPPIWGEEALPPLTPDYFDDAPAGPAPAAPVIPITQPTQPENGVGAHEEAAPPPMPDFEYSEAPPQPQYWLEVIIQRSDEEARSKRLLKMVHNILVGFHGHDRFSIIITGGERPYRMEFPDQSTHYCAELVQKLSKHIAEENIRVFNHPQ